MLAGLQVKKLEVNVYIVELHGWGEWKWVKSLAAHICSTHNQKNSNPITSTVTGDWSFLISVNLILVERVLALDLQFILYARWQTKIMNSILMFHKILQHSLVIGGERDHGQRCKARLRDVGFGILAFVVCFTQAHSPCCSLALGWCLMLVRIRFCVCVTF